MPRAKTAKQPKPPVWVDRVGQFRKDIGWKSNDDDQLVQHRFYLGPIAKEATYRAVLLEQLWEQVKANHDADLADGCACDESPTWHPDTTLLMAKALAKGERSVALEPNHESDDAGEYVAWLGRVAKRYPMIQILPAWDSSEAIDVELLPKHQQSYRLGLANNLIEAFEAGRKFDEAKARVYVPGKRRSSQTLHQAFDAYAQHILATKLTPPGKDGTQVPTQHAKKTAESCLRFKERHSDLPLSELTAQQFEALMTYWGNRPPKKKGSGPMAVKTCDTHIKILCSFEKWLHKSDAFAWKRPADLDMSDIKPKIKHTEEELDDFDTPTSVRTFTDTELTLLYKHATPMERALIILAMNCGFANAEVAGLKPSQCLLRQAHQYANELQIETSDQDSFISRVRRKPSSSGMSKSYGLWKLWPETVAALDWGIARRNKIIAANYNADPFLLITEQGKSFRALTKGNNESKRVEKYWKELRKRVAPLHPDIAREGVSFKSFRKTGSNLVRIWAGGEISKLYLSHTSCSSDSLIDAYTNKPYGLLFKALERLHQHLKPMFDSVGNDPFPVERKKGGANLPLDKIEQINRMAAQSVKPQQIAKVLNIAPSTVYNRLARKPK